MGKAFVHYAATLDGYEVTLFQGGEVLDHYAAGNHPYDSSQPCPPFLSPVPLKTLRKWARETALRMADEFGIPRSHVEEGTS